MYLLTDISRAHSSGYENTWKKLFKTLDEAAAYIHDEWYDNFCEGYEFPTHWDEEEMGCHFPPKSDFTPDLIKSNMLNKRRLVLLDAYSNYACLVPNEVTLEIIDVA